MLKAEDLQNLEIKVTEKGFSVWSGTGNNKRWVLDASMIKKDGEIRLGAKTGIYAKYREVNNTIIIDKE